MLARRIPLALALLVNLALLAAVGVLWSRTAALEDSSDAHAVELEEIAAVEPPPSLEDGLELLAEDLRSLGQRVEAIGSRTARDSNARSCIDRLLEDFFRHSHANRGYAHSTQDFTIHMEPWACT